ncbi:MAG: hypothetical protein AB1558_04880 [Thermodesulfobacteriota bacterium]
MNHKCPTSASRRTAESWPWCCALGVMAAAVRPQMEKLNITDVHSFDRKHLSRLKSLKGIEP